MPIFVQTDGVQWAVGSWQLAVGSWQLAVGSWQLASLLAESLLDFGKSSYVASALAQSSQRL
jgi:hypothetical protein